MNRFGRCLSGLSAVLLSAALFLPTAAHAAGADIPLDAAHFPDAGFRSLLFLHADTNGSGSLSAKEISSLTALDLSGWGLKDLRGIEYLTSLTVLSADTNRLKKLDLSSLTKLNSLSCIGNSLTELKLPRGNALKKVSCGRNALKKLDVSPCKGLTELSAGFNGLTDLDLSANTKLTSVNCADNELTSLTLPASPALTEIRADHNHLTQLDLDGTGVQTADLSINDFRTFSPQAPALTTLKLNWCEHLENLDLSGCERLEKLQAEEMNSLTSLDVSACGRLTHLDVRCGALQQLKLPASGKLTTLYAYGNRLSAVDLSGCAAKMTVWLFSQVNTRCTVSVSAAQNAAGIQPGPGTSVTAKPEAPVVSLSSSQGKPRLSWAKAAGADKYQVFRREGSGSWSRVRTVTGTAYTDEAADPSKVYQYKVRACTAGTPALCSEFSAVLKRQPETVPVPAAPASLTAKNTSGVRLEWSKVAGAAGYQVYRKEPGGSYTRVRTTANTAWVDTTAVSGRAYTYKVRAYVSCGASNICSPCTSPVTLTCLSQPQVSASACDSGVRLSWNKIGGASGYQVYRRLPGQGWNKIVTTASLSFADTEASAFEPTEYKVRAYFKVDGTVTCSAFSAPVSRTASGLVELSASASTNGVVLSWNTVNGAKGYQIYRKAPGESFTRIKTTAHTSYTDTTARKGILYTYKVRAYRAGSVTQYGAFSGQVHAAR